MNIDTSIHYFALMEPVETILGMDFVFYGGPDTLRWFECEVDESNYCVADGYKITLRNINGREYHDYYQSDFEQLIKDGCIYPKTSESMRIEEVNCREYIGNSGFYIQHEGECIVEDL
jgi:glutamyl/glutaminyl-tRNA synthetase